MTNLRRMLIAHDRIPRMGEPAHASLCKARRWRRLDPHRKEGSALALFARRFAPAACLAFMLPHAALSGEAGIASPMRRLAPEEIAWSDAATQKQAGSSMQQKVQSAVVFGDASRPALYSIMFKVEPNAAIPAHSHPDDRSCFVLRGVWYFGYGDRYAEAALRALPPGSHYTEPAGLNHFAGTRADGAVVECTSVGPAGTLFAEPATPAAK